MRHFAIFIIVLTGVCLLLPSCKKDKITGSIPVIKIFGNNPASAGLGYPYSDAGSTAADIEDGDISSVIITTNNVDISKTGTYYVFYNVTDKDGNKAVQMKRTVNVIDTK